MSEHRCQRCRNSSTDAALVIEPVSGFCVCKDCVPEINAAFARGGTLGLGYIAKREITALLAGPQGRA